MPTFRAVHRNTGVTVHLIAFLFHHLQILLSEAILLDLSSLPPSLPPPTENVGMQPLEGILPELRKQVDTCEQRFAKGDTHWKEQGQTCFMG